jgi:hypothetical protein
VAELSLAELEKRPIIEIGGLENLSKEIGMTLPSEFLKR